MLFDPPEPPDTEEPPVHLLFMYEIICLFSKMINRELWHISYSHRCDRIINGDKDIYGKYDEEWLDSHRSSETRDDSHST